MTGEAFAQWPAEMKAADLADTDANCGALLGITKNTVIAMKKDGTDLRTALACRALLHRLPPYDGIPL
jgi:hypothetical protein